MADDQTMGSPDIHPPDNAPPDIDPVVEAYKRDVDITLIRENLKLSVEERLLKLQKLQEFAEELRRAGREAFGRK